MPARDEADEIPLEELEAAGEMFDILVGVDLMLMTQEA